MEIANLKSGYRKGYATDSSNELLQSQAQLHLGAAYEWGRGVPVDFETAAFWYQKAVDQGLELAKDLLARTRGKIIKQSTSPRRNKGFSLPSRPHVRR